MKKLLIIAPVGAQHGEGIVGSIAVKLTIESRLFDVTVIDSSNNAATFWQKVLSTLILYFKISKLVFRKFDIYYFSLGRTINTNIRDALSILVLKIRNKRVRCIAHVHGAELIYTKFFLQNYWYKFLTRILDRTLILSQTHAKYTFGDGYENYVLIPNPVSSNNFHYFANSIEGDSINFVFMSNPIAEKGLDVALTWLDENINDGKFKLSIIGWREADYYNTYKRNFNPNLSGKIELCFLGKVYGNTKEAILSEADYFILPSRYKTEAQPLVLIEALKYNAQIVTSRLPMFNFFEIYDNHHYLEDFSEDTKFVKKKARSLQGEQRQVFDMNHDLTWFKERLLNAINS